ncbi:transposase [Patescibacteria group bacterium]|nr:transposase [Patescibacteria group bacterium]
MSQRKQKFLNGEIYHIAARRIGDELLFKDINDYYRGIFSIFEFNTIEPILIRNRRKLRRKIYLVNKEEVGRGLTSANFSVSISDNLTVIQSTPQNPRDLLVEILGFCFMPNHIHLLVRQLKDGGISKFMQKFGSGYAVYFKGKHNLQKKGYFFQNKFNSVHIETEDQLRNVFVYIHTNPAALIESNWKEKGITNPKKVIKFLEEYKWSSYQDYIGKKNFPSVTKREWLLEIMGSAQGCKKSIDEWVKYKGEIREFGDLALEN